MDDKTRAVRVMLENMAPVRSIPFIESFQLPEEEARFIIDREARGKSLQQIALENNVSIETVKRRRRSAFYRISNSI